MFKNKEMSASNLFNHDRSNYLDVNRNVFIEHTICMSKAVINALLTFSIVETCKYGNINELDKTSSPSTIKVTFLV